MVLVDYFRAKKLLERYGIKSIEGRYVASADEAVKFAGSNPIALKLLSEKALHKTKAGVVKLNLAGSAEIQTAFRDLQKKGKKLRPYKIIAQSMSKGGIEFIVGGNEDAQFGKMILAGLGGIYVETFKDFQLRLCPISKVDAESMLSELKSGAIITYDGAAAPMLSALLMSVSRLLTKSNVKELDLNPVIVRKDSYDIVDIRMLV